MELRWSDLSLLKSVNCSSFEIFLHYQEEANGELFQGEEERSKKLGHKKQTQSLSSVKVLLSLSSRGVTVAGLSPGSIYSFTLRATHPAGSVWSLGQTRTAYTSESAKCLSITHTNDLKQLKMSNISFLTGPPSPQNITFGPITVNQISVHWMLTGVQLKVGWTFVIRYLDMSTREERIVGMTSISRISETDGLQSYTAVIGGLESHRKYRVGVYTVTQSGIESCEQEPVTVQTGKYVTGLLHNRHFEYSYRNKHRCY